MSGLTWKLVAEGICFCLFVFVDLSFHCYDETPEPKATWGGKGASLTVSYHSSSLKEDRAGTQGRHQGQELTLKLWTSAVNQLAPPDLLSLSSYTISGPSD